MNKKFHSLNRFELLSNIQDDKCMVVLSSGYEINQSADENYPFQVNNNFYYLTGIKQPNVHLIMLKDKEAMMEILYIDEYSELHEKWLGHRLTIKEASSISGIYRTNVDYLSNFYDDLEELSKEYNVIYLDLEEKDNVNYNSFALSLKEKLDDNDIKNIYEEIVKLRMVKKPCEIACLKKAIATTKKGIESLMQHAKSQIYEYQLEAYFDLTIKQEGNFPTSFKTIAASGVNATTLHYSQNNTLIKDNDLILFDLGSKYDGYCADITRTFPVSGKFNKLQKTIYNIVLKANLEVFKKAHAGMTLKELQEICIDVLAKGCLKAKLIKSKDEIKKYYFHGVSHSIGLDTHDPYIRSMPLPVNAVISNEPGLYFKEYGIGVRIEDDLLIKKDHAINLSKSIIKKATDIEKFMSENNEKNS